jgi:hypothetical protein
MANTFWEAGGDLTIISNGKEFTFTNPAGPVSSVPWDYSTASSGGATRIRSSTWNFLANSSFEFWNEGTSVAPSSWTLQGDATVSRITPGFAGDYAAQIVFGTANTGELFQPIGTNTQVDYVFTCYVERTAGTGAARLVAQRNDAPFTEFASVDLPTGAGQNLVTLRFMPTAGTLTRFAIKSGDTNASTWKVDECMYQESKDVATTWQPRFVDDQTNNQNVYGLKVFNNGLTVGQPTLGSTVQSLFSLATNDNPTQNPVQNRVTTNNAVATVLHTFSVPASTTLVLHIFVVARRTGGSAGGTDDGAGYRIFGTYRNVAGTATIIGANTIQSNENQAAWNAALVTTGATVELQVTGAANNDVVWHMTADTYAVST